MPTLTHLSDNADEAQSECMRNCKGFEECTFKGFIPFQPVGEITNYRYCEIYHSEKQRKKRIEILKGCLKENVATFQNFESNEKNIKALGYAKRYAEGQIYKRGGNLILLGGYGTGKTHLAVSILKYAVEKHSTYFVNAHDMGVGTYQGIQQKTKELIEFECLCIDDFSLEADNKLVAAELYALLNGRYEAKRGTVITTNLSLKEFKESIGDRIFDRLAENGIFCEVKGESYRKTHRKEWN